MSSRYPNMSYCMFENTKLAMDQLIDNMREALENGREGAHEFLNDMSREERRAFNEMFGMCEDLMNCIDEVQEYAEQA